MKLRLVNKLYRRNKTTSKELDDSVMSENCDFSDLCGLFGAIRKRDSGRIDYKTYIFINSNLLF